MTPPTRPDAVDQRAGSSLPWLLAALSFGAGVIHLVMVPQHSAESLRIGFAFAVAGWLQIAFGVGVLGSPRRGLLAVAAITNLGFIAVWAVSRTVGLPAWTGAGGVEAAGSVDLVCVAFEAAFALGALVAVIDPRLLAGQRRSVLAAALAPLAVLIATTTVLTTPGAAELAHGDEEVAHAHEEAAATGTAATAGHSHGTESGMTYAELSGATKAEVDQVIAGWGHQYATAADAMADGWRRATRSLYGIGAHYIRGDGGLTVASTFDMLEPNILLFDGESPDARFAGVSYVVGGEEPVGFTGDDDVWHRHDSVCLLGGTVASLSEEDSPIWLSDDDCMARGGRVHPLGSDLMMHLWIGPGYIDNGPIMAHDHPWLYGSFLPQRDA